ncbi:prolyl 3-hydroxylase OGFOD1-like [Tubulanus polymorphus]|uniref:prolyl 3-hydroxylase OGFOD1-like n=1 Tax=Tubulanus polymorphus TaxID=672921 RepID=UPI003DA3736B
MTDESAIVEVASEEVKVRELSENAAPPTGLTRRTGGKAKSKEVRISHLPEINVEYLKDDFRHQFASAFSDRRNFMQGNGSLIDEPFLCGTLDNFIADEQFLDGLKDELLDQIFHEKNNDLYKFQQSEDLKKMSSPHVKFLRKMFSTELLNWMRQVTGIPLSDKIDMTCSKYDYTDTLLCHDDELEGRRIAFILYLVPPWKPEDGGALDLFNVDDNGQPSTVAKSIFPAWNKFAFFEVSPVSFHQVAEVLTEDKTRLSVNGWFHGPNIKRPSPYVEAARRFFPYVTVDDSILGEWISPIYLDLEVQAQIQDKFEQESEIELQGFLKEEKYAELVEALKMGAIRWEQLGPPNKRNYCRAKEDSIPDIVKQCQTFFQSEAMFLVLSNLTGLSLHEFAPCDTDDDDDEEDNARAESEGACATATPDSGSESDSKLERRRIKRRKTEEEEEDNLITSTAEEESMQVDKESPKKKKSIRIRNPRCRVETRRWKQGCYTLVHDTDQEAAEYALDLILYLNCKSWNDEAGGFTSYIAKGEDEELLTVNPAENSLALVYRDKHTLKFVKHINNQVNNCQSDTGFYDIAAVYYE